MSRWFYQIIFDKVIIKFIDTKKLIPLKKKENKPRKFWFVSILLFLSIPNQSHAIDNDDEDTSFVAEHTCSHVDETRY